MYRILSTAFQAPTEERLRKIGAFDDFAPLITALSCLDDVANDNASDIVEALRRGRVDLATLAAEYWRVFGHTTRGLVCPCETEYGDDNKYRQPQELADIAGYYLAFGLKPQSATELRHDHVSCECEFMAFLNLKQALLVEEGAQTEGGADTLEVTRQAARTFLRDHLGRFGRACAASLAADDSAPYYSAWGALCLSWLEREHARLGIDLAASPLPLRGELVDDAPMACGSASELIQIRRS
jgi:TorA maturation chaperone TorD